MNLPVPHNITRHVSLFKMLVHLAITRVGRSNRQKALPLARAQELQELHGNPNVLLEALPDADGGARRPPQQQRLQQRRVRDGRVAGAERRQEPRGAGAGHDCGGQVAHDVEMRPAEEQGALAGPRV